MWYPAGQYLDTSRLICRRKRPGPGGLSRLLKTALEKAKARGSKTARGVIQSLIIQTSAARQWSAQEVAYLLLGYELVDCTWGTAPLRIDRKRPMRKISDNAEVRGEQRVAGAPYLDLFGRRGDASGSPANWGALSPFEFIRSFNLRFGERGELVCEARAEEPVVVVKPMLFPHASDREKMSRFRKGRLLAYLPDEPGWWPPRRAMSSVTTRRPRNWRRNFRGYKTTCGFSSDF